MKVGKNMINSFSLAIKESKHGDEYYTPRYAVCVIEPFLKNKFKHIWCPFDTEQSEFVKVFHENRYDVTYGHIATGQDFFAYEKPPVGVEVVVSNPPYSLRQDILKRLYEWNIPFALTFNMNGLFDSNTRFDLCAKYGVELLIPRGRMHFMKGDVGNGKLWTSPNFQTIYVCHNVLSQQIVFTEMNRPKGE